MNFRELEEIIKSGVKEIALTEDVTSEGDCEDGIEIGTDGLVIDGNNHTIDSNRLGRIFIVEAKNVTLKNIAFVNGKARGGGAIVNYGADLRIVNCCFKNNWTNGGIVMRIKGGGAIGSYSDMSIFGCRFEDNACCGDNGGAIYLEQESYGPIPNVVIKNCEFKNNHSDGANNDFGSSGGAIYNENADLFLYDCRFEGNGLTGWSNFDYNEAIMNGGTLSLDGCLFSSEDEGHFIYNTGRLIARGIDPALKDLILNEGTLEMIEEK